MYCVWFFYCFQNFYTPQSFPKISTTVFQNRLTSSVHQKIHVIQALSFIFLTLLPFNSNVIHQFEFNNKKSPQHMTIPKWIQQSTKRKWDLERNLPGQWSLLPFCLVVGADCTIADGPDGVDCRRADGASADGLAVGGGNCRWETA